MGGTACIKVRSLHYLELRMQFKVSFNFFFFFSEMIKNNDEYLVLLDNVIVVAFYASKLPGIIRLLRS